MNKELIAIVGIVALLGTAAVFIANKDTNQLRAGQPSDAMHAFQAWKHQYGKKYADPDFEAYRFKVFSKNLDKIKAHHGKSYTLAINQFADLTTKEFSETFLGFQAVDHSQGKSIHSNSGNSASSVDWRKKKAVSEIKDQGQCGSCWSFSTTGSLESADAIFGSGLGDFSEQQLVDCSGSYGNQGCNGGLMDQAFQYVIDNGITNESDYPYKAVDGKCKKNGGDFKISKYTDVNQGDCDGLKDAIAQQPVSVAVDAESWQFYSGGVFSDCGTQLDHGVLAVGYTSDYYIVKNSWGSSWGEDGFIRLKSGNTCGICNAASYPTI